MSKRWLAKELAKRDKSLVGFWPLQENCIDYSGQTNHIRATNLKHINRRKGLDCQQGVSTFLRDVNSYSFDFGQSFSVSFWLYVDNTNVFLKTLFSNFDYATGQGWEIILNSGTIGLYLYTNSGGGTTLKYTAPIVGKNIWKHVVISYGPYNCYIYIDGILTSQFTSILAQQTLVFDTFNYAGSATYVNLNLHAQNIGNGWFPGGWNPAYVPGSWSLSNQYSPHPFIALQKIYNLNWGGMPFWMMAPTYINAQDINISATVFSNWNTVGGNHCVCGGVFGRGINNNNWYALTMVVGDFPSFWPTIGDVRPTLCLLQCLNGVLSIVSTVTLNMPLIISSAVPYVYSLSFNGNNITGSISQNGIPYGTLNYTDTNNINGNYTGLFWGNKSYSTEEYTQFYVYEGTTGSFKSTNNLSLGGTLSIARIYKRKLSNTDTAKLHAAELDIYRPRKVYKLPSNNQSITLYVAGIGTTGNIPLYIDGGGSLNNNIPLFIYGKLAINNNIPLYIYGKNVLSASLNLYTASNTTIMPVNVPLVIIGSSPSSLGGLGSIVPFYIYGDTPKGSLNLFVSSPLQATLHSYINLFIGGDYQPGSRKSIPLFLANTATNVLSTMYPFQIFPYMTEMSKGLSYRPPFDITHINTNVGTILNGSLNLFLQRWPTNIMTLFIAASSPINSGVPLYEFGQQLKNKSLTLTIPSTLDFKSKGLKLFESGW